MVRAPSVGATVAAPFGERVEAVSQGVAEAATAAVAAVMAGVGWAAVLARQVLSRRLAEAGTPTA